MKRIVLISLVAVVFIGCQDGTSPTEGGFETADFVIRDGSTDGNEDVFFLPPLVPNPTPANTDDAFGDRDPNPDLEGGLVARICERDAGCEDGFIAELAMEFQEDGGFYRANWRTRDFGLENDLVYQITIVLGSGETALELAFRDVTPVKKAKGSCKAGADCDFKNGSTLPIKVRIETGAGCLAFGGDPDNCAMATVEKDEKVELEGVGSATPTNKGGTINIQPCVDFRARGTGLADAGIGRVDLPTFGPCIEIIPLDPDLTGIATLCDAFDIATDPLGANLTDEQARRMTVHRHSVDDAFAVALSHAEGPECAPSAPEQALELNTLERFVRFARNTWRAVSDRVVAWIEPAPLYARTMVRCNRGGCSSIGEFRSHYEVAQPAWMDFDPAGPGDGDFGNVLVGNVLTVKVNAFDSGEFESPPVLTPVPEPVEGVRLTFTATGGSISAPAPAVCVSGTICTVETDEFGDAEVTLTVVLDANTVVVSGIGVGTEVGAATPVDNVFAPSMNDAGAAEVTLEIGTLEFTATGIQPDLIVFSLEHSPAEPRVGEDVTITAVVKNIGTAPAAASEVLISVDGDSPATVSIGALDPDESASAVRVGQFAAASHDVTATADAGETIPEILEDNNTADHDFTVIADFHDLRRDGDIAVYQNYNAWGNKDEIVLTSAPFSFIKGVDYFERLMSELSAVGGIPEETSLIIISSASNGDLLLQITEQRNGAANLEDWVRDGGWLVIHAGDNSDDDYIVPGLSGPVDETLNCTGLTLTVGDHALLRGPDATLGTGGDDLNDTNIDNGGRFCFDNHGSLSGLLPAGAEVLIKEQQGGQRPVYATYTLGLGRVIVTTLTLEFGAHTTQTLINHFYWAINGVDAGPSAAPPAIVADAAAFDVAGGGAVLVNTDGTKRN